MLRREYYKFQLVTNQCPTPRLTLPFCSQTTQTSAMFGQPKRVSKRTQRGVLSFLFRGVILFRSSTFEHYPFVGSDAFARKVARVLRTETQLVFVCLCICTILHDLYGNTKGSRCSRKRSHAIRRLHRFDVSVLIQSTLKFHLCLMTVHCAVFG